MRAMRWIGAALAMMPSWAMAASMTYTEDQSNFPNPERGFYPQPLVPGWCGDPQQTTCWLTPADLAGLRAQGITLVTRPYAMANFRNSPIDADYISHVNQDLALVRAAGLKMIPSFCYNWINGGPDAPESIVLSHIAQLAPVLQDNADVIAWMPVGFIGNYGEGWGSTNNLVQGDNSFNASSMAILQAELAALPPERMLQIRYVENLQTIYGVPLTAGTAYTGTVAARLGGHDNSTLHDDNDAGTFSSDPGVREQQKTLLAAQAAYSVMTGEGFGDTGGGITSGPAVMAWARQFSYSAFQTYSVPQSVLDGWKNTSNGAESWYDTLAKSLGYRFRLVSATADDTATAGGTLHLSVTMANDGTARPVNPRSINLVMREQQGGTVRVVDLLPLLAQDARLALPAPGTETTWTLAVPVPTWPAGTYALSLALPDPKPSLAGSPDYAIRMANQGVWNATTGENDLGLTVTTHWR